MNLTKGRIRRGVAAVAVLAISGGAVIQPQRSAGSAFNTARTDAIQEAVFRYQIVKHPNPVYFLSVGHGRGRPVSATFLRRFRDVPGVESASEMRFVQGRPTDKRTGRQGARFWVESPRPVSPVEATVQGGGMNFVRGGNAGIFDVVLRHGRWMVTSYKRRTRF